MSAEFPPNSNAAKAAPKPRERIRPVTSASAVRRKRGLGKQFKEAIVGGDSRGVAEHVFFGVIVPSLRDLLFDALETGLRAKIYGESGRGARRGVPSSYTSVGHAAYNRMSSPATVQPSTPRSLSRQERARNSGVHDLIVPSREEAEDVIDRMFEELGKYNSVSVATLYELTGVRSSHTDMKWGWTDLRGSKAVRRGDGFLLVLPEPTILS